MPIYEYRCLDCDTNFEQIVLGSDADAECPNCDGNQFEQLFSSFAVGGGSLESAFKEPGPCGCGAPQRGMCGELPN
jgi:putative FmdB family regulatory protein